MRNRLQQLQEKRHPQQPQGKRHPQPPDARNKYHLLFNLLLQVSIRPCSQHPSEIICTLLHRPDDLKDVISGVEARLLYHFNSLEEREATVQWNVIEKCTPPPPMDYSNAPLEYCALLYGLYRRRRFLQLRRNQHPMLILGCYRRFFKTSSLNAI